MEELYRRRPHGFMYYWYYMMREDPPEIEENEPYGTDGLTKAPWTAIGATTTEEPQDEYYYPQAESPVETTGHTETEEPLEEHTHALNMTEFTEHTETEEPAEEHAPALNMTELRELTETEEPPEVENEATTSPTEDPGVDFKEQTTPAMDVAESVTNV